MKNTKFLYIIFLCFFLGCVESKRVVILPESIPNTNLVIISINIVEGKTTKQDIISRLGDPYSISTGSDFLCFSYSVNKKNEIWQINFVLKDGYVFRKTYKQGMDSFYIYFNSQGYVSSFRT